jgi:pyrroloquinoline quinone (PQQ) biosynthesis protein C
MSSVADARTLVSEIHERLKPVEERLKAHPYLAALEDGRIPREKLRLIAGEQYHIINSDLRSITLLLDRHSHLPSRDYLLESLRTEAGARAALLIFARACDMSESDLRAYEPLPGCQAYPAYVAWLGSQGSDAEFAAAFLVNLPAWGAACGRMSVALKERYGLPVGAVVFFDLFAQGDPSFEENSLRVIQDGLDRGIDPSLVARAARLIQAYELLYWDTLYETSV